MPKSSVPILETPRSGHPGLSFLDYQWHLRGVTSLLGGCHPVPRERKAMRAKLRPLNNQNLGLRVRIGFRVLGFRVFRGEQGTLTV